MLVLTHTLTMHAGNSPCAWLGLTPGSDCEPNSSVSETTKVQRAAHGLKSEGEADKRVCV